MVCAFWLAQGAGGKLRTLSRTKNPRARGDRPRTTSAHPGLLAQAGGERRQATVTGRRAGNSTPSHGIGSETSRRRRSG